MSERVYQDVPRIARDLAMAAREGGKSSELGKAVLAVAMHEPDRDWATAFALSVIAHPDANVRGNAVLALGHIARIHGWADSRSEKVVIESLADPDPYVRGHARSAMDDLTMFAKRPAR